MSGGKVYAGGSFQDAGGNANADFLAVWNGTSWGSICAPAGPTFLTGNVTSLEIIGQTLYVGGVFQNWAGNASADYLLACNLATGASSPVANPFPGPVYALAADGDGTLYAGGTFTNLGIEDADYVAYLSGGGWHAMAAESARASSAGSPPSGPTCTSARTGATSRASPQADHVARWNGSKWRPWAPAAAAATGGSLWGPRSTP